MAPGTARTVPWTPPSRAPPRDGRTPAPRGTGPLGWLPDKVAALLVARALERCAGDGGVLLLEGYPGTPAQA